MQFLFFLFLFPKWQLISYNETKRSIKFILYVRGKGRFNPKKNSHLGILYVRQRRFHFLFFSKRH